MVDLDGFLEWLGWATYTSTQIHGVPLPYMRYLYAYMMLTLQPPPTEKNEIYVNSPIMGEPP